VAKSRSQGAPCAVLTLWTWEIIPNQPVFILLWKRRDQCLVLPNKLSIVCLETSRKHVHSGHARCVCPLTDIVQIFWRRGCKRYVIQVAEVDARIRLMFFCQDIIH
jgi:hypothetical protein